jgi:hypothetical protein
MIERYPVTFMCTAQEVVLLLRLLDSMLDSVLDVYAKDRLYIEPPDDEAPPASPSDFASDDIPF